MLDSEVNWSKDFLTWYILYYTLRSDIIPGWPQKSLPNAILKFHSIKQAFDFRLQEYPRKDGFRSKLIIRPVTESDFGDYNCTVQNSHGVDSYIITLKEERKFIFFHLQICIININHRLACL